MTSTAVLAMRIGAPCEKCRGTGHQQFDWGTVQVERLCPHCIGTGMRGRHRA
jgi:DnaJ-class molecular chaperone